MDKNWVISKYNIEDRDQLQTALKINPSLCNLLVQRGIKDFESARLYFRPQLTHLHDPFLMKGMDIAVERIIAAINNKQSILLYGDYDVDGTTAVAVVHNFLNSFVSRLEYYIPNRFKEGYGISEIGVQYILNQKIDLVITLDCGIKSEYHINHLMSNGVDVIVCDHHLPDENIPNALAILNPKQADCSYPFKELCGCGIGFKLISAIEDILLNTQVQCLKYLDLVAAAIAADIVPIVDENRILAYYGLQQANTQPSIPIQALKISGSIDKKFTISDLVFIVAPRVNAAGRMDDAKTAVKMFISNHLNEANEFAELLNINNDDRRDIDKQTTQEALELLSKSDVSLKTTVLHQPNWHKGVVGIVASRLIENKFQPTIILTDSNGKISGSARSIPGLNLFEVLNQCAEYLETFGGHYFAAGLTLLPENLEAFKIKFDTLVKGILTDDDFIAKIQIDTNLNFNEITDNFYNIITEMEPFGPENMRPIFVTRQVNNYKNYSGVVKEKHIKFYIQQGGIVMKGIGFNLAHKYDIIDSNKPFDMVYYLTENEWNGQKKIELRVIDIASSK
jgi:single-stranded-DNA-specific exonuclease